MRKGAGGERTGSLSVSTYRGLWLGGGSVLQRRGRERLLALVGRGRLNGGRDVGRGRSIGRSVGCSVGCSVDHSIGRSVGCSVGRSVGRGRGVAAALAAGILLSLRLAAALGIAGRRLAVGSWRSGTERRNRSRRVGVLSL